MKTFGLIGKTLAHSYSAQYFNEKFSKVGIHAEYKLFELDSIHHLPELIRCNPSLCGLNITIPYKQSVFPYLDFISESATKVGAVNTVSLTKKNNAIFLEGFNTDTIGFEMSLLPLLSGKKKIKALVLGTGGSSRAVVFVLNKMKIPILLISRNPKTDFSLGYHQINKQIIGSHKLIINTTPAGMFPKIDEYPVIPYQCIDKSHILFDLVYNPAETKFLEQGRAKGAVVQNGLEMLRYQAEASWELWNLSGE